MLQCPADIPSKYLARTLEQHQGMQLRICTDFKCQPGQICGNFMDAEYNSAQESDFGCAT